MHSGLSLIGCTAKTQVQDERKDLESSSDSKKIRESWKKGTILGVLRRVFRRSQITWRFCIVLVVCKTKGRSRSKEWLFLDLSCGPTSWLSKNVSNPINLALAKGVSSQDTSQILPIKDIKRSPDSTALLQTDLKTRKVI